jgi:DNA-binding CsgD family transcriptional regulator
MKARGVRGFIHNLRHIRLEAQYDRRMLASTRVCGAAGLTMGEAPLIVASNAAVMEACVERLERSGVVIRRGWEPGTAPASTELVCAGHVDTARDAEAALLAVLGGAGIVAVLPDDDVLSASFFEDLRRLGGVEVADESPQNPLERLDEEQRRLLDLLANGLSVTAASRRLFLSRRTADRRLARARAMLGVRSNAEAVVVASWAAERTV